MVIMRRALPLRPHIHAGRRVRHWAGPYGLSTALLSSLDGVSFTIVASLNPADLSTLTLPQSPPLRARYLAVRHTLQCVEGLQCRRLAVRKRVGGWSTRAASDAAGT